MNAALDLARTPAYGHTYPNPPVGCVIVSPVAGDVRGKGFHPKAGFPHAEVYALFQAAGMVEDGVEAAGRVARGEWGEEEEAMLEKYKVRGSIRYGTGGSRIQHG